ncbi:hypothetical protein GDO81_012105 [Engystomops pustulosus]|uniref:Uncharacterized protein n=1 Tax=Engystomops pustulosus TaxID=76066 RepID=A0AAV7BJC7_ENGPU|nr:hypothetical protein GDO81_012105 [Engystomops pustulosus]
MKTKTSFYTSSAQVVHTVISSESLLAQQAAVKREWKNLLNRFINYVFCALHLNVWKKNTIKRNKSPFFSTAKVNVHADPCS